MTTCSPDIQREIFRAMLRVTFWEQKLLRFIEEGRTFGFYHAGRGQEATAVGAVMALRLDDYLLYDHRGMGHAITKGVPLDMLFADFLGFEQGTTGGLGAGIVHIAWPEVGVLGQSGTLGGSFPIAAGAGISIRYLEQERVVLCFFGDGASNRGTFHEAANAAALWDLPVIWLCENNGYAVSVPASESLSVPQVADRAVAYGMPGVVVDGMDPIAVYEAVAEAAERARSGGGPTLIEAMTYRYRGHYEGDPTTYRTDEEVASWREKDPLVTFPQRLVASGVATEEWIEQVRAEVAGEIEAAAELALAGTLPPESRIFKHVYV
jgi:TPP-dependent pyruvate/acetoin dehydrogenase alpha subunit